MWNFKSKISCEWMIGKWDVVVVVVVVVVAAKCQTCRVEPSKWARNKTLLLRIFSAPRSYAIKNSITCTEMFLPLKERHPKTWACWSQRSYFGEFSYPRKPDEASEIVDLSLSRSWFGCTTVAPCILHENMIRCVVHEGENSQDFILDELWTLFTSAQKDTGSSTKQHFTRGNC